MNELNPWPKVFLTGQFLGITEGEALSDALTGWGHCHAGLDMPDNFGHGMMALGVFLDTILTPERTDLLFERWMHFAGYRKWRREGGMRYGR